MWVLNNETPFAAERTWTRDETGAEIWLVAVRGTFLIEPDGRLRLASEQQQVCRVPEYRDSPDRGSVIYESDLVRTKASTDVLVNGHAHAGAGRVATELDVTLKVGALRKRLRVFGDRVWSRSVFGLRISPPKAFERIPLIYERAFGGTDTVASDPALHGWEPSNPVGRGFAVQARHLDGMPAPNVEHPESPIRVWNDRPVPVGFGAVAAHWRPRVGLAGTYDDEWMKRRRPLPPLDFDPAFYQCAPTDQQVSGYLKGGEVVELVNLSPGGSLRFQVPRVSLNFWTRFSNGQAVNHRAVMHTLCIEPDVPRVLVTWHADLPCHHLVHKLLETTVTVKRRIGNEGMQEAGLSPLETA